MNKIDETQREREREGSECVPYLVRVINVSERDGDRKIDGRFGVAVSFHFIIFTAAATTADIVSS